MNCTAVHCLLLPVPKTVYSCWYVLQPEPCATISSALKTENGEMKTFPSVVAAHFYKTRTKYFRLELLVFGRFARNLKYTSNRRLVNCASPFVILGVVADGGLADDIWFIEIKSKAQMGNHILSLDSRNELWKIVVAQSVFNHSVMAQNHAL